MLYYPQTNRQEVYEMTAPKKPPITKSFGYAFEGIFTCIRKERNMKIHCVMAVLVVIAGIILKLSPVEWCICLGLFGLVMALELGEHRSRIRGRPGDQRVQAPGEDR